MGFVLDVADYGARSAPLRSDVQRRLPVLVSAILAYCGMALASVEHEWTGDGINVVMPADADPTLALPVLLRTLARLLGEDNARSSDRLRLRMSVGIGLVENSAAGFGGPMIIEMSRLVDCAPLRAALAAYPDADLAVAISDQVHSAIIRPGYPGIPGAQFSRAEVAEKEFRAPAWIWISTRQWTTPAAEPLSTGDPRGIGDSPTARYRLVARLGAGRASTVYLAVSAGGTPLAVKVFRPEAVADADARGRLATGVKAAGSVQASRIARVMDADPEATGAWLATALVPGPSLDAVVTQTGPLPLRSALWLSAGVAQALTDIHQAGIAHGALRPSNVLLAPDGPVLTDCCTGWAVVSAASEEAGGLEAGPPAGARGGARTGAAPSSAVAGPADDVLALGCLAFFAATGRTPYGDWYGEWPGDRPASGDRLPRDLGDPDLTGCPPGLLPVVQACLLPPDQRPATEAVRSELTVTAGSMPRAWLPPAVAARFADYQALPRQPSRSGRGRDRRRPGTSGLVSWLFGHR